MPKIPAPPQSQGFQARPVGRVLPSQGASYAYANMPNADGDWGKVGKAVQGLGGAISSFGNAVGGAMDAAAAAAEAEQAEADKFQFQMETIKAHNDMDAWNLETSNTPFGDTDSPDLFYQNEQRYTDNRLQTYVQAVPERFRNDALLRSEKMRGTYYDKAQSRYYERKSGQFTKSISTVLGQRVALLSSVDEEQFDATLQTTVQLMNRAVGNAPRITDAQKATIISEIGGQLGQVLETRYANDPVKLLEKTQQLMTGVAQMQETGAQASREVSPDGIAVEGEDDLAGVIIGNEARRDGQGRIAVYELPDGDGGGSFEVAGINDRYHPEKAAELRSLIQAGRHDEAEAAAKAYVMEYTAKAGELASGNRGVELIARDMAFNRGQGGANAMFRLALGRSGAKGAMQKGLNESERAAVAKQIADDPAGFMAKLTEARATYESEYVGTGGKRAKFQEGLRNRWQSVGQAAQSLAGSRGGARRPVEGERVPGAAGQSVELKASQSPMTVAQQFLGKSENEDTRALAEFFKKAGGQSLNPAKTAWCAAFVNAALGASGIKGTGTLAARDFLKFGTPTDSPTKGDIVVFSRGDPNGWQGHVGFYAGKDKNGNILVLGGNQGKAGEVSVASYPASRLLGYRKPPNAGEKLETASGQMIDFEANTTAPEMVGVDQVTGGAATPPDIMNADVAPMTGIGAEFYNRMAKKLPAMQEQAAKAIRAQESQAYVQGIMDGQIVFNPQDDQQRKAVDEHVRNLGLDKKLYAVDPQDDLLNPKTEEGKKVVSEIQNTVALANRLNHVPQPLADAVYGLALSKDPRRRQYGLEVASSILESSPNALLKSPDLQRRAEDYKAFTTGVAALSPEEAVERLDIINSADFKRDEKALEPMLKEKLKQDYHAANNEAIFQRVFDLDDGFWTSVKETVWSNETTNFANLIAMDFRESFSYHYIRTNGDAAAAEKLAAMDVKKTWGTSAVTGQETVMQFPPDLYLKSLNMPGIFDNPNKKFEYVTDHLKGWVTANIAGSLGSGQKMPDDIDMSKVQLRGDEITQREMRRGETPSYAVIYKPDDGPPILFGAARWSFGPEEMATVQDGMARMFGEQRTDAADRAEGKAPTSGTERGLFGTYSKEDVERMQFEQPDWMKNFFGWMGQQRAATQLEQRKRGMAPTPRGMR